MASALLRCVLIAGAMCASFGAFGMWILVWAWMGSDAPFGNLLIKALFLSIAAGGFSVLAIRSVLRVGVESNPPGLPSPSQLSLVVPVVVFIAILLLPGMGQSPKAEPDELHHLIVARNIAEHAVYGSGHPDSGFIEFDQYDSVGAPVLLPVAMALKIGGTSFVSARFVMALFGIVLGVAAFLIVGRREGPWAGVVAAALVMTAPMSVYLGRTLYGEVPALLFFFLGAAFWGRGIEKGQWPWHGIAGLCLGMAILSKTFMVIAAWPFAVVGVYLLLTTPSLRWHAVVLPPIGVALIVGLWTVYEQSQAHDVGESAASTLFEYQHFLLFGIEPLPQTIPWWLHHPGFTLTSLVGFGWAGAQLFTRRRDPAFAVIYLFGVLVIFWWLFYSTGRTPRYLWYACAIGGLFAGMAIVDLCRRSGRKSIAAILAALVILSAGWRTVGEIRLIHFRDQHEHERALVDWMGELPEDSQIATAFWPLQRLGNFAANRPVALARGGEEWDVLLWKSDAQNEVERPDDEYVVATFGPYVAFRVDNR